METALQPTTTQVNKAHTLDQVLTAFIGDQDCKDKTKQAYAKNLRQYFAWITENGTLDTATREHIVKWKAALIESGKTTLTVSTYLSTVRRFYEWAEARKFYPNIAKGVKAPRRKQAFRKYPLTVEQSAQLIKHFENRAYGIEIPEAVGGISLTAKMQYAIINLLIRTGLRTIEVVRANIEDMQFKGGRWILLVQGKGYDSREDYVVLTDRARKPIIEYLNIRGAAKGPLFVSTSPRNYGQRLTTKTISLIAKTGLRAIGLDQSVYTAHSLRHTCAVNIRRGGGSEEQTQQALRHASPVTTQMYSAIFKEENRLKSPGEDLIDKLF